MEDEEAQVIADAVEEGCSVPKAHMIVIQNRQETNQDSLTLSAVYGCMQRLKPRASKIG